MGYRFQLVPVLGGRLAAHGRQQIPGHFLRNQRMAHAQLVDILNDVVPRIGKRPDQTLIAQLLVVGHQLFMQLEPIF